MPLYEYACPKCGTFELIRKFADAPLENCPTCNAVVTKQVSSPAFQFKGTGWYVTDYARKGQPQTEKKDSGSSASNGSSADSKATPSTPSGTATSVTNTTTATKSSD